MPPVVNSWHLGPVLSPGGYVGLPEDRLYEPRSRRLNHRREHPVRGPGRVSAEAVSQICHLRRRLDPPGDLAGRQPEDVGAGTITASWGLMASRALDGRGSKVEHRALRRLVGLRANHVQPAWAGRVNLDVAPRSAGASRPASPAGGPGSPGHAPRLGPRSACAGACPSTQTSWYCQLIHEAE